MRIDGLSGREKNGMERERQRNVRCPLANDWQVPTTQLGPVASNKQLDQVWEQALHSLAILFLGRGY